MDTKSLAAELIRALRAKRSQTWLSRRLGYRTNVVYVWEAARGAPTAAGFLQLAERLGVDVQAAYERFYRMRPTWLQVHAPASPQGVAAFLDDLRGNTKLVDVAASVRRSRFAVARWMSGSAQPRLPDFLQAIEATSLRLLDYVAQFVDPAELPSVRQHWQKLQAARAAAYDMPWSHAVLRLLELRAYRALARHRPGWIAEQLGITPREEERCLQLLSKTGQIRRRRGKWSVVSTLTVDIHERPEQVRQLKAWWAQRGTERLKAGASGVFSYNLFNVSNHDLQRLQDLQRAYFRELRAIVARSSPAENLAVVNLQLFSLLSEDGRAACSESSLPER